MQSTEWRCQRCGSSERRPRWKGCADCYRRQQRAYKWAVRHPPPDDDSDIVITPAMSAYLEAFTAFLHAQTAGDTRAAREAAAAKHAALTQLEDSNR